MEETGIGDAVSQLVERMVERRSIVLFLFFYWSCVFEFNGRIHLRHPAGTQYSHDPDAQ